MLEIHYVTGGTASVSINPKLPVLVSIPGTLESRVTPTYADQILPGHQAVMTYGDSQKIASAIARGLKSGLDSTLEETRLGLELEIEELGKEVQTLNDSRATRAKPFLDYAQSNNLRVDYGVSRMIESGESDKLKRDQISPLVSAVYRKLNSKKNAHSSVKDRMRNYIQSGIADEETLQWFAENIDPIFGKLVRYRELKGKLDGVPKNLDTSSLEQSLANAIDAIKSGQDYQREIEFECLRIDVNGELKKLVGVEPAPHFLVTIDSVVEGQNADGLIVPFQYDAKRPNVPGSFKPYFMPTTRLGQIITLFDGVLRKMLVVYADENQSIRGVAEEIYSKSGKSSLEQGIFMRAVFPDTHKPTQVLYSDARIQIPGQREKIERIIEIVRKNLPAVPAAVASHFNMPKEEVKFDDLLSLQVQLMQLLPMSIYKAIELNMRHGGGLEEDIKHIARLTPDYRIAVLQYQLHIKGIKDSFGVNMGQIPKVNGGTLVEATQLFGDKFNFIRKLEGKEE